ncbi:two-component sensor histidine kinase, partial [Streptomyces rochei]|nr:two-component sensor histidine kinase [Streptomyces rochei]
WGEPGGGSQFRLTLPRTADEPLRGSPIPLEPADSRRNRGLGDAGLSDAATRDAGSTATVPTQTSAAQASSVSARGPIPPRSATVAPTADPTALPGNGARVVPRPPSGARKQDGGPAPEVASRPDAGPENSSRQGEATRGR